MRKLIAIAFLIGLVSALTGCSEVNKLVGSISGITKEGELKAFPVTVNYEIKSGTFAMRKVYMLRLIFHNHGSESYSFAISAPVVVDSSGTTYNCLLCTAEYITIYPDQKIVKEYPFEKLPDSGNLYIDVYVKDEETGRFKKSETLKLSLHKTS
ncbi:hypothetical protein [Archaeoglobus profundus]|uniref:DUF4352 domain-containing protein n=1 Tax=Archaeoglobus profundus (strain DSM 5631 / JCM 9629 / NBRC 100127 / Av18) TaxID=572546 RepID=D2RI52_ARCPA|nr:hypothetical protein [Archaeoglobus profundus]ADB57977.1 hypothetical protein Arcpr_0916 [Archaeoglobus profundus DSM 5631]